MELIILNALRGGASSMQMRTLAVWLSVFLPFPLNLARVGGKGQVYSLRFSSRRPEPERFRLHFSEGRMEIFFEGGFKGLGFRWEDAWFKTKRHMQAQKTEKLESGYSSCLPAHFE